MDDQLTCKTPEALGAQQTTSYPHAVASMSGADAGGPSKGPVGGSLRIGTGTILSRRYLLGEELDRGGMGAVFRATDLRTGGTVAVKLLHPMLANDPSYRERLRREAQFAAAIHSPYVVHIFDLDEHEGTRFLVMEYVSGETLKERLRRQGRFAIPDALEIGADVARALDAASTYGIVHRDLKPENVMVADGQVKVLDFGIAWGEGITGLTIEGAFVGTPEYSAPERISGRGDVRSDIYSIGVLLFALVEGRLPFRGPTPLAVLRQHETLTPVPAQAPPIVQAVIARCLAKDPADRFQTPRELVQALEHARFAGSSTGMTPLIETRHGVAAPSPEARGNLPVPLTSFVGRQEACDSIRRILTGENGARASTAASRLLTLTGLGGSGKTRLALQVAGELGARFSNGAVMVELGSLDEPALVVQAVAAAVGAREIGDQPLEQTLAGALRSWHMLLVLDNCEHLAAACAHLVEMLLRTCPGLSIIATSREPLGILGETVWPVVPLRVPDPERVNSAGNLLEVESVQLFVERARSADPTFKATAQSLAAIARICYRLDGIPLAIELAAARVKVLSVEQIESRLSDRFRLLTGGGRAAPARQKTLRATIDWSYDLLSGPERMLLQRLSMFSGSFDLEGTTAVGAGGKIPSDDVLDLLAQLVDRSLVLADSPASGAGSEVDLPELRYRLLETIREYARERLEESGEESAVFQRFGAWCVEQAERAKAKLSGPDQAHWLARLESEHDNFRHALRRYLSDAAQGQHAPSSGAPSPTELIDLTARPANERVQGQQSQAARSALRLCVALWRFWIVRGYLIGGRESMRAALEAAKPFSTLSTKDGAAPSDPDSRAWLGLRASALNGAANLAHSQGDDEAARELHLESLALHRLLGDRAGIAASLNNLGVVSRAQHDLASARQLFEEALSLQQELGLRWPEAITLTNLGNIAFAQGDMDSAKELFFRSLRLHQTAGDSWGEAMAHNDLGNLAYDSCDLALAKYHHLEALRRQRVLGERSGMMLSFSGLGAIAGREGDHSRAATLLGVVDGLQQTLGIKLPPTERGRFEQSVDEARSALDDSLFRHAWETGRALQLKAAIESALDSPA